MSTYGKSPGGLMSSGAFVCNTTSAHPATGTGRQAPLTHGLVAG